jgi:hypothetical protein
MGSLHCTRLLGNFDRPCRASESVRVLAGKREEAGHLNVVRDWSDPLTS